MITTVMFNVCHGLLGEGWLIVSWLFMYMEWKWLKHPNITPLYGYIWEEDTKGIMTISLVSLYHLNGDIIKYLDSHPQANCL